MKKSPEEGNLPDNHAPSLEDLYRKYVFTDPEERELFIREALGFEYSFEVITRFFESFDTIQSASKSACEDIAKETWEQYLEATRACEI